MRKNIVRNAQITVLQLIFGRELNLFLNALIFIVKAVIMTASGTTEEERSHLILVEI